MTYPSSAVNATTTNDLMMAATCTTPIGYEAYKLGACDSGVIMSASTAGNIVYLEKTIFQDAACKTMSSKLKAVFTMGVCSTNEVFGTGIGSIVAVLTPKTTIAGS
jgi:hypothetical protein